MSRRVQHAPERVLAASAAWAGCGPLGSPGLALWLRGERGLVPPGSLGHLAAPELAGAPSVVIFASAYRPPTLPPRPFLSLRRSSLLF